MAAKREFCSFPPNGEYEAGGACLQGEAKGKSTQITCKGQMYVTPLGPETHQSTNGNMSSSATNVDSCSSGSTIGFVFEDWL